MAQKLGERVIRQNGKLVLTWLRGRRFNRTRWICARGSDDKVDTRFHPSWRLLKKILVKEEMWGCKELPLQIIETSLCEKLEPCKAEHLWLLNLNAKADNPNGCSTVQYQFIGINWMSLILLMIPDFYSPLVRAWREIEKKSFKWIAKFPVLEKKASNKQDMLALPLQSKIKNVRLVMPKKCHLFLRRTAQVSISGSTNCIEMDRMRKMIFATKDRC